MIFPSINPMKKKGYVYNCHFWFLGWLIFHWYSMNIPLLSHYWCRISQMPWFLVQSWHRLGTGGLSKPNLRSSCRVGLWRRGDLTWFWGGASGWAKIPWNHPMKLGDDMDSIEIPDHLQWHFLSGLGMFFVVDDPDRYPMNLGMPSVSISRINVAALYPEIEQWQWGNGAIPWEFGIPCFRTNLYTSMFVSLLNIPLGNESFLQQVESFLQPKSTDDWLSNTKSVSKHHSPRTKMSPLEPWQELEINSYGPGQNSQAPILGWLYCKKDRNSVGCLTHVQLDPDLYIAYGNAIYICGGRARPRGPGGSMKHQFHPYV